MSLPLPEGTHLAYMLYHEIESWQQLTRDPRWPQEHRRTVVVEASPQDGEAVWSFHVVEHDTDDGLMLQVDIFDATWQAFAQIPEFFAALAEGGQRLAFDDVIRLLDSLGAVNETERTKGWKP